MEPPPIRELLNGAIRGDVAKQTGILESLRVSRLQHPDLALKCGTAVLSSKNGRRACGNDLWAIYEQVAVAALHLDREDWYQYCYKSLLTQFPKSIRVKRLEGMMYEKKKQWQQAEKVYSEILTEKPADTTTRKRLITILKGQKKITEAVDECNAYLELFTTDVEVWHELAEIYLAEGCLAKAQHCFVELVLSQPRNSYVVITYAELQYSLGDMEVARKYFCLAAHLDETNFRALWGLLICLAALGAKRDEKLTQLHSVTKKKLINLYYSNEELPQATKASAVKLVDTFT